MLIKKDGTIKKNINTVILTNNRGLTLDNNQFFKWTNNGKKLELWEGNPHDENGETCSRICYWLKKSVIAFYS